MNTHKSLLLLIALLAPVAAAAQDPLIIYNGRAEQFVRPAAERFTEQTGIPVVLHAGSATELLNRMRLEGGRTEADLILSNDAGALQIGENEQLFAMLPGNLLARVAENDRGAQGSWIGLSARARVLVVNTNAEGVDSIRSVRDIAHPRWRGRLGLTSSSNESFVGGLSVYQALWGDDAAEGWLRGLQANVGTDVYPRHGAVVSAVAAGERAVGLVNHYYVFRHLAEHPDAPIRLVVPDQQEGGIGAAWNVAGIAVSRHSDNQAAARAFIAFLLSEDGQRIFADVNMEFPTAIGVAPHPDLARLAGSVHVADLPLGELATRRGAAIDLIDKVGMP